MKDIINRQNFYLEASKETTYKCVNK